MNTIKNTSTQRCIPIAIGFLAVLLAWETSSAGADESFDPLQSLGGALTQCVTSTRGDAGLTDEEVSQVLMGTRDLLARIVADTAQSLPKAYEDDIHLYADLGEMLTTLGIACHSLDHGDRRTAHHACKDVRLQLAFIRSRNGVVAIGDMIWRYNCAFHPMMHEIMHTPKDAKVTPEQIEVCRKATRSAAAALAAAQAVAQALHGTQAPELLERLEACKASLAALDRELARELPQGVKPKVKEVRSCFIQLVSLEAR